jgi:hypothetical protein
MRICVSSQADNRIRVGAFFGPDEKFKLQKHCELSVIGDRDFKISSRNGKAKDSEIREMKFLF